MSYDLNADGSIDRGENPKNPGDRGFGHGDQITLEFDVADPEDADLNEDGKLPAGYFVNFDGDGGVVRQDVDNMDAVLKHDAEPGELVTVHVRGAIRVAEDPAAETEWPVITALDDDDYLIALR